MRKVLIVVLALLALVLFLGPLVACSDDKSDPGIPIAAPSECPAPAVSARDPALTILEPQSEPVGSILAPQSDAGADAADASFDAGAPLTVPHLVIYGNSIVFGAGLSNVMKDSFGAIARADLGKAWQTDWIGRGGWAASQLYFAAPHDLPALSMPAPRRVFVFYEGTNDMGNVFSCDVFEAITRARVAEGWDVIVGTVMPTTSTADDGADSGIAWWVQRRHLLNDCIATNAPTWGAKAVWDIGRDPRMANPRGPNYADGVHPSAPGYVIMGHSLSTLIRAIYP